MIDYENEYRKRLLENIKEFQNNLTSNKTNLKIQKYSEKYGLNYEFVKYKVYTDNIFALQFIIEPNKQNLHENIAFEYLKTIDFIKNPRQLEKSGMNSLIINNDGIVEKFYKNKNFNTTKTIDFYFEITTKNNKQFNFYSSHKYTKDKGGSQDNQYNDLKKYLDNASKNKEDCNIFLAICDGQYYNSNKNNKINEINKHYSNINNIFALNINQLNEFLIKFIDEN